MTSVEFIDIIFVSKPPSAMAAAEAALPVVDLRSHDSIEGLAAELLRVGRDPGFFYVVGHELGDDVAAGIFALAEDFFRSPLEDKLAHANGSGDLVSSKVGRHGVIWPVLLMSR